MTKSQYNIVKKVSSNKLIKKKKKESQTTRVSLSTNCLLLPEVSIGKIISDRDIYLKGLRSPQGTITSPTIALPIWKHPSAVFVNIHSIGIQYQ